MDISFFVNKLQTWQEEYQTINKENLRLRSQIVSQDKEIKLLTQKLQSREVQVITLEMELEDSKSNNQSLKRQNSQLSSSFTSSSSTSVFKASDTNVNVKINAKTTSRLNSKPSLPAATKKSLVKREHSNDTIQIPTKTATTHTNEDMPLLSTPKKLLSFSRSDVSESTVASHGDEHEEQDEDMGNAREILIPTQYTLDSNETRFNDDQLEDTDDEEEYHDTTDSPSKPSCDSDGLTHQEVYTPQHFNMQQVKVEDLDHNIIPTDDELESPIKIKAEYDELMKIKTEDEHNEEESLINDSYEVEDSQFCEDDTFFDGSILKFQLPTPSTTAKKQQKPQPQYIFQTVQQHINNKPPTFTGPITPLVTSRIENIAYKKHQLEHDGEETPSKPYQPPSKRPKIAMPSLNEKIDLTFNPDTKQQWSMQDFIVNTNLNEGLNYAYGETAAQREHSKSRSEPWAEPREKLDFFQFEIMEKSNSQPREIEKVIFERLQSALSDGKRGKFVFREKIYREIVSLGRWKADMGYIQGIIAGKSKGK